MMMMMEMPTDAVPIRSQIMVFVLLLSVNTRLPDFGHIVP